MWFDAGSALQVGDEVDTRALHAAFATVPGLLDAVGLVGLAPAEDLPATVAACELVLEALVARRRLSRSESGRYQRAPAESRRRPDKDVFGGGLSA
jgi:magnesium chelatase subunit I